MLVAIFALLAVAIHGTSAATVFAHFMVQNTYAYDVEQWQTDMAAAQLIGIDGFALNWVPPDCQGNVEWQITQIDNAFTAAEQSNFTLMYSFDMSYTQCNIYWNQTFMQSMITKYASSSAAYRWNNNLLVSTYGGDTVDQYGDSFFSTLKDNLAAANTPISLAPALTSYSDSAQTDATDAANNMVNTYSSVDGFLNWQAWPLNTLANSSITADQAFQQALQSAQRTGPYIMAVSPWQFKDLDDGNPEDAWVEYSDYLFWQRFEQLTSGDIQPDIIELITWNDFAESHYLRTLPSQASGSTDAVQIGNAGNYIWGHDHTAWGIIAKYYISWWKNGSPPAITEDQVVYWYRVHPRDIACGQGSSSIRNSDYPADAVFAWALVSSPADISMSIGSNQNWVFSADNSGPATGFIPFPSDLSASGDTPSVAVVRNGQTIQVSSGQMPVNTSCSWQDYNPVVNVAGPALS